MEEKLIFQGYIFDLIRRRMEVNGHMADRDIVVHSGGVALCAVKDDQILLVEQSRAAVECRTLEIPAGTLEKGEDPKTCGMRELNEETGYTASDLELITAFWPTPGYDTEVIWVYDVKDVRPAKNRLAMDADEDVRELWLPLQEAFSMISSGKIRDGKTIIAIYYSLLKKAGLIQD